MIFNYEPLIEKSDIDNLIKCIHSGIAQSKHIDTFEKNLNDIFKIKCTTTASGTAALHLSLLASNIGPGDEIICPSYTFAASWNAILYTGAKPIFVDACKDTWCIDPQKINGKITNKTKAILTVDLFGNPCNYENIKNIAIENNLLVIQDAAESLGSLYKNKSIFSFGDISCTSFNLNKIITSCGGGAVFSNKKEIIEKIILLKNQNKKSTGYDYDGIGFNYRMGSINAAIANTQLNRIDEIINKKNKINETYRNNLPFLQFQKTTKLGKSNNWLNVVKFKNKLKRDKVLNYLIDNKIEAKLTFKPASSVNYIKNSYNINQEEYCNSNKIFNTTISLPSSPKLSIEKINYICNIIKKVI